MRQITLHIEESKFKAFLSFIKTLNYVKIKDSEEAVDEGQMEEVEHRLKLLEKYPEKAIDFDETIEKIERKYGL